MTAVLPSRAIVLAGGRGTRLAPYTTVFPKPLMPIDGRPVLELVLRRLRHQGITRVTLAVSYLEELIRAFFGDGRRVGVELEYYREDTPLGTAGVLAQLAHLPDPCLLMNGDVLSTVDIAGMVRVHAATGAAMTVATQKRSVHIDYGVLDVGDDGLISRYTEKPSLHYAVSAGINLIGARARRVLRPDESCDVPTLVQRLLAANERLAAYYSDAYWRDIGRPSDYEQADAEFPQIRAEFGL